MWLVFDNDGDLVGEVYTEAEAIELAEATFGRYVEA